MRSKVKIFRVVKSFRMVQKQVLQKNAQITIFQNINSGNGKLAVVTALITNVRRNKK